MAQGPVGQGAAEWQGLLSPSPGLPYHSGPPGCMQHRAVRLYPATPPKPVSLKGVTAALSQRALAATALTTSGRVSIARSAVRARGPCVLTRPNDTRPRSARRSNSQLKARVRPFRGWPAASPVMAGAASALCMLDQSACLSSPAMLAIL